MKPFKKSFRNAKKQQKIEESSPPQAWKTPGKYNPDNSLDKTTKTFKRSS